MDFKLLYLFFLVFLCRRCEIRPGPEYLLRSYTFKSDGSYRATQHRYWDDSCSLPKFTIVSTGMIRIKRDSLMNPDAATGYVKPINITITPHDSKSITEFEELTAGECAGQVWKPWRRYEEHVVFNTNDQESVKTFGARLFNSGNYFQAKMAHQNIINSPKSVSDTSSNINCLGSLKWAFSELKLIKVQLRPVINSLESIEKNMKQEMLLGDVHSQIEQREHYTPTSFGKPLLKFIVNKEDEVVKMAGQTYHVRNTCTICSNLYSASDKSPPHLLVKPHLPPYIWGEWTSVRCEMRPMGLYLTRKFSFYSDDSVWVGEHKFYEDPFCTVPKFVITAAGHFSLTSGSTIVSGATNIDFKIERASLTLYSKRMVHEMRMFNSCGKSNWESGVPQELSSTNGCLQMGIIIPSVQHEIVKVEMNYEGSCLLYLGQADTDNMPRMSNERPTAFQEPLVKCGDVAAFSDVSHHDILDERRYYADQYDNKSNRICLDPVKLLVVIILIIMLTN